MIFKKIVGIGDSWIYGDELLNPELPSTIHYTRPKNNSYREANCFLGLLGRHYNVPVLNLGIPGGSLQSSIWSFLQWVDTESNPSDCLVLIGLTESDRLSHYDAESGSLVHSTWEEHTSSRFHKLFKQQIAYTSSDKSRKLNYQQTVMTFDGIAARQNLKLLQFHISDPPITINVPTLLNLPLSLTRWFTNELQVNHGQKYTKEHGHPNEIGHELVSNHLISYIDSCKMYA